MGKKKSAEPRVRINLVFKPEVAAGIQKLAADADISLNQLMHELAKWATQNAILGEPKWQVCDGKQGFTTTKPQPGCITFGKRWKRLTREERIQDAIDAEVELERVPDFDEGEFYFVIDVTERRIIREE